jgi:dTDP-glucose 4,6-dehydratase
MSKNILITGGAGFIGSHVVRLFVNKYPDYRIINLDALTYAGNLENLSDVDTRPNYQFVKANILDIKLWKKCLMNMRLPM